MSCDLQFQMTSCTGINVGYDSHHAMGVLQWSDRVGGITGLPVSVKSLRLLTSRWEGQTWRRLLCQSYAVGGVRPGVPGTAQVLHRTTQWRVEWRENNSHMEIINSEFINERLPRWKHNTPAPPALLTPNVWPELSFNPVMSGYKVQVGPGSAL